MPAVLITGANRGLGLEFARQYLADGWQVFAACRDPASAGELQQLARGSGGKLTIVAMDVTEAASIRKAAIRLEGVAIDLVINSAGIANDGRTRWFCPDLIQHRHYARNIADRITRAIVVFVKWGIPVEAIAGTIAATVAAISVSSTVTKAMAPMDDTNVASTTTAPDSHCVRHHRCCAKHQGHGDRKDLPTHRNHSSCVNCNGPRRQKLSTSPVVLEAPATWGSGCNATSVSYRLG
jgi:NAD(P)-dependent dehydrogenase (short-subunit alcohol dehydrogenase family)